MCRASLISPYLTLWFNVSFSQYLRVVTKFANFNQATATLPPTANSDMSSILMHLFAPSMLKDPIQIKVIQRIFFKDQKAKQKFFLANLALTSIIQATILNLINQTRLKSTSISQDSLTEWPDFRGAPTSTGRPLAAMVWPASTTLSSELRDNEKSDRHMEVSELPTCSRHTTNIPPPGTDSLRFRGTASQGPVTAGGDTTTGRPTATGTTARNQHQHHLATLTQLLGSQTRRRLISTGRASAAMVSPVSTTLSGSELKLGSELKQPINNILGDSKQVCPPPLSPSVFSSKWNIFGFRFLSPCCFWVKHI